MSDRPEDRERTSAEREDPTRIFAALADTPIPEDVLDAVSAGVAAAIRQNAERPPAARHRGRYVALSAVAASVLLAVALVSFVRLGVPEPATPDAVAETLPVGLAVPVSHLAGVEILSTPGEAQVVDLTVGEMQVVMIFDEEMDL